MIAIVAALPCVLLSSPTFQVDETLHLVDRPAPETSRRLSLRVEHTLSGGALSVQMNGEDVPAQFLPELDLQETDITTLVVTETIETSDESGPLEWTRRYVEVARSNEGSMSILMSSMGQDETYPWSADAETDLEDATLRLSRTGGETRIEPTGSTSSLPEDLAGELGFALLLPTEPVAEGAKWTVSGSKLTALLEPGGDLGLEFPEDAAQYLAPEIHSEEVDGELRLSLGERDGDRALVSIEGELRRITVGPGDLSQVPVVDGTATDTTTESIDVTGTLIWDVSANCLVGLELEGEVLSETVTERDAGQPGSSYESVFTVEGRWSFHAESEPTGEEVADSSR